MAAWWKRASAAQVLQQFCHSSRLNEPLENDEDGETGAPIFWAAKNKNEQQGLEAVQMLVRLGADPRTENDLAETPVDSAREAKNEQIAEYLEAEVGRLQRLQRPAAEDWQKRLFKWAMQPPPCGEAAGAAGEESLSEAVLERYDELLRNEEVPALYGEDGRCDVDAKAATGGGKTALMASCEVGNLHAARLLVQSFGANLSERDNGQKTVLRTALLSKSDGAPAALVDFLIRVCPGGPGRLVAESGMEEIMKDLEVQQRVSWIKSDRDEANAIKRLLQLNTTDSRPAKRVRHETATASPAHVQTAGPAGGPDEGDSMAVDEAVNEWTADDAVNGQWEKGEGVLYRRTGENFYCLLCGPHSKARVMSGVEPWVAHLKGKTHHTLVQKLGKRAVDPRIYQLSSFMYTAAKAAEKEQTRQAKRDRQEREDYGTAVVVDAGPLPAGQPRGEYMTYEGHRQKLARVVAQREEFSRQLEKERRETDLLRKMNRRNQSDLEHYQQLKEWKKRAEEEKDRLEEEVGKERNSKQIWQKRFNLLLDEQQKMAGEQQKLEQQLTEKESQCLRAETENRELRSDTEILHAEIHKKDQDILRLKRSCRNLQQVKEENRTLEAQVDRAHAVQQKALEEQLQAHESKLAKAVEELRCCKIQRDEQSRRRDSAERELSTFKTVMKKTISRQQKEKTSLEREKAQLEEQKAEMHRAEKRLQELEREKRDHLDLQSEMERLTISEKRSQATREEHEAYVRATADLEAVVKDLINVLDDEKRYGAPGDFEAVRRMFCRGNRHSQDVAPAVRMFNDMSNILGSVKAADQFIVEDRQNRAELQKMHRKAYELHADMKNTRLKNEDGWGLHFKLYGRIKPNKVKASILRTIGLDNVAVIDGVTDLLQSLASGRDPARPEFALSNKDSEPWLEKCGHLKDWDTSTPLYSREDGRFQIVESHRTWSRVEREFGRDAKRELERVVRDIYEKGHMDPDAGNTAVEIWTRKPPNGKKATAEEILMMMHNHAKTNTFRSFCARQSLENQSERSASSSSARYRPLEEFR